MRLQHLEDPLAYLRETGAEFDWQGSDRLEFNERYRQRQLPLLNEHSRRRDDLADREVRLGEFWPPVRCALLPIDEAALSGNAVLSEFLAALRDSAAGACVWWPGLALRQDRVHCNIQPDLASWQVTTDPLNAPLEIVVRGPWIGRLNPGRIYLPVEIPDPCHQQRFAGLRTSLGAAHDPMIAGFLQLAEEVTARKYAELRNLVHEYQDKIRIPVQADRMWVLETMDSLILRSRIAQTVRFGAP